MSTKDGTNPDIIAAGNRMGALIARIEERAYQLKTQHALMITA